MTSKKTDPVKFDCTLTSCIQDKKKLFSREHTKNSRTNESCFKKPSNGNSFWYSLRYWVTECDRTVQKHSSKFDKFFGFRKKCWKTLPRRTSSSFCIHRVYHSNISNYIYDMKLNDGPEIFVHLRTIPCGTVKLFWR